VAVCISGFISDIDCIDDCKFPGDKSGGGQPGEKFENGMIKGNGES